MALAALAALAIVALTAYGALDLAARHTTERRDTYTGVRTLVIDGASDVHLTGAPAGRPLDVVSQLTEGLRSPHRQVRRHGGGELALSGNCPGLLGGSCNVRADRVKFHSSAGDVFVSLLSPATLLDADSSAGDVELVVPNAAYRVDAASSAGDVDDSGVRTDPSAARSITARSSAGDVRIARR
jgi:hypothetical protein